MSENESPIQLLNRLSGQTAKQWRETLLLSQSDMAEILTYTNQSLIDVGLLDDWETGEKEFPAYLYCFIERFYNRAFERLGSIEPGVVMAQRIVLADSVLQGMKTTVDDDE